MVTPELRFDEDGFLDLSVFPDTEPDVHGHGPGVLDPALDVDRRALDGSFDAHWIDAALTGALDPTTDADGELATLVPAPAAVADATTAGDVRPHAVDEDDIDLEDLRAFVLPEDSGDRGGDGVAR